MRKRIIEEYDSENEEVGEAMTVEEREQVLRSIIQAAAGNEIKLQQLVWGKVFKEALPFMKLLRPPWHPQDYPVMMTMIEEEQAQSLSTVKAADLEHRKYQILRVPDLHEFDEEARKEPALVLVDRETGDVEYRSADTSFSFVPTERMIGHRNLFKDIMTTVRYAGGVLVPIAPLADFETANPCPQFKYKGIEAFANGSSKILKASGTRNMSSREKARYLAKTLQEMSTPNFVKLMMTFYVSVFKVKTDEKGLVLTNDMPLDFLFRHPSMANEYPEIGSRRSYIYRSRGLKMRAALPKNDKDALSKATGFRTWRGEGENFYSLFTQHYNRGGDPSKDQVQVCQALSLILPANEHTDLPLVIRPSSTSVAKHLGLELDRRDVSYSFHLSEQVATSLRVAMKTDVPYVEAVPFESLYVDLHSMELPTVPKGVDVFEHWQKLHDASVPKAKEWIARRKVFPTLIDESSYFYYPVNSSHAYDVIESNIDGLVKRVGVVDQDFQVVEEDREMTKLTGDSLRSSQFTSNRKKTCFLQSDDHFKVDETLNLWEPPIELQKRDMRLTKVTVEAAVAGPVSRIDADMPDELPAHKRKKRREKEEEVPAPKQKKKPKEKAPPKRKAKVVPPPQKAKRKKLPTPSPSESEQESEEEGDPSSDGEGSGGEGEEGDLPTEASN